MKSYFTRSSILIITAWFTIATISGQKNQVSGSIVNNSGIRLDGTIVYQSENELSQTCQFKTAKGAELKNYLPTTIKSYEFQNRKFVSVYNPTQENRCFMEQLANGKLNLYFSNAGNVHFFINNASDSILHPLPYFRDNRYVDNGYTKRLKIIESTFHTDTLKMLMSDKPGLFKEIEAISSPDKKSLIALVEKYNSNTTTAAATENTENIQPTLLSQGKLSLYVLRKNGQPDRYFIRKITDRHFIELPFSKNKNQSADGISIKDYTSTTTNHIDTLKKYMADAPALQNMIENIFVPTARNLSKLVDEYNSYTDEASYEKKHNLKRLPINLDIVPGIYMVFINTENPVERLGMNINCGFTNRNTHYFLKTGLFAYKGNTPLTDMYYTLNEYIEYSKPSLTLKIPMQLECRFSENSFQPLISFGYNYYHFNEKKPYHQALMPVICPGVNINMGKRLSARISAEIEFNNKELISWTPEKLKRAGLFAGLQIKL